MKQYSNCAKKIKKTLKYLQAQTKKNVFLVQVNNERHIKITLF